VINFVEKLTQAQGMVNVVNYDLINRAYELTSYTAKSLYYQCYTNYSSILSELERDKNPGNPNSERIGDILQSILNDVKNDIFLKPSVSPQEPDLAPRSVMDLTKS
jgi:hypothetical protein